MVRCLTIAYRGTNYAGWQRQVNGPTVQAAVEEALSSLAGERIQVVAASRTDAGVHARGQAAHLEGAERLPGRALVHGTIRLLPDDIRIMDAVRMRPGFHARRHATSKLYSYSMERAGVLSPLRADFSVRVDPGIDAGAMQRAAAMLVGEHDFTAFALSGGSHDSPRRRIFTAEIRSAGTELEFLVSGSGFLRGMVRGIVGTLIEIGLGRFSEQDFAGLLLGAPRSSAGPTAPPQGLVLEKVVFSRRWRLETGL